MRKSSKEVNYEKVIRNIGYLCGEELEELPYWETINNYLKRLKLDELQKVIIIGWREVIDMNVNQNSNKKSDTRKVCSLKRKKQNECFWFPDWNSEKKKMRSLLVRAGCGCNRLEKSSKKVYYNKYDVGSKIHFDPFEIQETWSKSGLLLKKELGRLPPKSPLKSRLLRKKRYWNSVPCHVLAPNCLSILSYRTVKISEQNILILS